MKYLAGLILLLLIAIPSAAQTTAVTGTITDVLGIPYSNAPVTANLTPYAQGQSGPYINGAGFSKHVTASTNAAGTFSMTLGDNSLMLGGPTVATYQWVFTVTNLGLPPPVGTGPQSYNVTITISGSNQSVSSTLSASAPALTNIGVRYSNMPATIASGFGTGATVSSNGPAAIVINVGTGGTATSGVLTLPTAPTGWDCHANDITTTSATVFITKQTASTVSSATIGNFNTSAAAAAWVASDLVNVSCFPY